MWYISDCSCLLSHIDKGVRLSAKIWFSWKQFGNRADLKMQGWITIHIMSIWQKCFTSPSTGVWTTQHFLVFGWVKFYIPFSAPCCRGYRRRLSKRIRSCRSINCFRLMRVVWSWHWYQIRVRQAVWSTILLCLHAFVSCLHPPNMKYIFLCRSRDFFVVS